MIYRTMLFLSVGWILVTGILVVFLVMTFWLGTQRSEEVSRHISYATELQRAQEELAKSHGMQDQTSLSRRADLLSGLADAGRGFSPASADYLDTGAAVLYGAISVETTPAAAGASEAPSEALSLVQRALARELASQRVAFDELSDLNTHQAVTSATLVFVLVASTAALLLFVRRRVLRPLRDLQHLMGLLARKEYDAAIIKDIDPLMAPLFVKYNRMVKRMRDMDEGHVKLEGTLQRDVDEATRALFKQQAALARADRMAAVGDVTARLAHDLRNPLSGVLLALTNMRVEVRSAEHAERLRTVIDELERVARLLDNVVNYARMTPERPERLKLSRVVSDVVRLLRFQIYPEIAVNTQVPEDIYCRLPDAGFRHVLLNLVLNAAQAIGERPGTIEIVAELDEDGQAMLAISDDGSGFPEELIGRGVHEHGSWRSGGTGLGLASARRFAIEHGARLQLDNKPEGGAIVLLVLPVDVCD